MERSDVFALLKKLIWEYLDEDGKNSDFEEHSNLLRDLHINSAHLIDLVIDVEDRFNITIEDALLGKMTTVGSSVDVILSKLG